MELYTAKQVAKRMGVTQQTVSRLSREGKLPFETVGARRAYTNDAVTKYLMENNLSVAPDDHSRRSDSIPSLTALSFFSGALGLDLGMEMAGIAPLLMCENEVKCRMTIEANRPETGLLGDVSRLNPTEVYKAARLPQGYEIDVMFGGPPCQAFSTAGARRAFLDSRGNVFLQFLDLAAQIRPKYIVIENVRGLLSTAFPLERSGEAVRGGAMRTVLNRLDSMGYATSFNLYNSANYGSPQIRERVVIIAKRDGARVPWLIPTHSNDPVWGLPAWKTLGEALRLVEPPHHYTQFPEKRLRYFRLLKQGQYWRDLPSELQPEAMGKAYALPGGKTGFYRRLSLDKPCATLVTSPTMPATDLCHPIEDRPLSIEEYRAVQGFPPNWIIRGALSDVYRQIGNAVPISLGYAIGKAIVDDMTGSTNYDDVQRFKSFPYSRYRNTSEETWSFA